MNKWQSILAAERERYAARGEPLPGRERLQAAASRGVLPGPTKVATALPATPRKRRSIEGWAHALAYAYDPEPVAPPSTTQAALKRIATGMRLSTACLKCHGEGWLPVGDTARRMRCLRCRGCGRVVRQHRSGNPWTIEASRRCVSCKGGGCVECDDNGYTSHQPAQPTCGITLTREDGFDPRFSMDLQIHIRRALSTLTDREQTLLRAWYSRAAQDYRESLMPGDRTMRRFAPLLPLCRDGEAARQACQAIAKDATAGRLDAATAKRQYRNALSRCQDECYSMLKEVNAAARKVVKHLHAEALRKEIYCAK